MRGCGKCPLEDVCANMLVQGRMKLFASTVFVNYARMPKSLLVHVYSIVKYLFFDLRKPRAMAVSALEAALIETWSLYAVGSIVIMLRIFSRTRMVGVAGWHPDDYMIFFAWVGSHFP